MRNWAIEEVTQEEADPGTEGLGGCMRGAKDEVLS